MPPSQSTPQCCPSLPSLPAFLRAARGSPSIEVVLAHFPPSLASPGLKTQPLCPAACRDLRNQPYLEGTPLPKSQALLLSCLYALHLLLSLPPWAWPTPSLPLRLCSPPPGSLLSPLHEAKSFLFLASCPMPRKLYMPRLKHSTWLWKVLTAYLPSLHLQFWPRPRMNYLELGVLSNWQSRAVHTLCQVLF